MPKSFNSPKGGNGPAITCTQSERNESDRNHPPLFIHYVVREMPDSNLGLNGLHMYAKLDVLWYADLL